MERDRTALILERMIPDDPKELTLDQFLGILGTYYWWTDEWQNPEDYIDKIFADASHDQLDGITEILHSNFPICEASQSDSGCTDCASDCFLNYLAFYGDAIEIDDHSDLVEELSLWAEYTEGDDDDEVGPIRRAYERWLTDKLAEEGATDIEIGNALEVLQIEEARRRLCSNWKLKNAYASARRAGDSFEDFTETVLVEILMSDDSVDGILNTYSNEFENRNSLTVDDQRRLVRRYIGENRDYYYLLEVSYLKYEEGILPHYLYRFTG